MKKTNSQAETHSNQAGPPRAFHRYTQKHTAELVDRYVPHHRSPWCVAILQHLFFLFIYRLQAQAHSRPGSLLRGSRLNLFFFIYF